MCVDGSRSEMSYENPKIPEGINLSKEHPLKEFAYLLVAAIGIVIILAIGLSLSAEFLAPYVPFETEIVMSESIKDELEQLKTLDARQLKIQAYLQDLAGKLAVNQELPENMIVTVHYVDDDLINAFATLGGHILIYRGLLEKLPHENALSMVMAHEIAHIKHRDPLISIGRGVTVMLLLSAITGFSDNGFIGDLLGQAGLVTTLRFGREQETSADLEAMDTLQRYYHHLDGAAALFEALINEKEKHGFSPLAFLRTHPLTSERIERINHRAAANPRPDGVKLVELPEIIKQLHAQS